MTAQDPLTDPLQAVIERVETGTCLYSAAPTGAIVAYVVPVDDWREMRATLDRVAAECDTLRTQVRGYRFALRELGWEPT